MGYEVQVTSRTRDGGKDLIAHSDKTGYREQLRIECKRYDRPVGIRPTQRLLGVLADDNVGKGVLITASRFTREAECVAMRNPQLELIDGKQLILLLNEHLGSRWPLHIERLVSRTRQKPY
jgi:restriction system protein